MKPIRMFSLAAMAIGITTAASLLTGRAAAQQWTGGLTAGMATGSVKITQIPGTLASVIEGDHILGVEAGAYAHIDLDPFYIKPQLLFEFRNGDVEVTGQDAAVATSRFSMHRLEVPLLLGLRIIGPVGVEAGPVYNYIISSTPSYNQQAVSFRKSGLGYRLGAAASFNRLSLSVSYQGIAHGVSLNSEHAKFQAPHELTFGIGYRLGNGGNGR